MLAALQRLAAAQGITPQQAFTDALREYLNRHLPSLPDESGATPPASLAPARGLSRIRQARGTVPLAGTRFRPRGTPATSACPRVTGDRNQASTQCKRGAPVTYTGHAGY